MNFGTYMNVRIFDRWGWADRARQFVDQLLLMELRWRVWCLVVPSHNRPNIYLGQPHNNLGKVPRLNDELLFHTRYGVIAVRPATAIVSVGETGRNEAPRAK